MSSAMMEWKELYLNVMSVQLRPGEFTANGHLFGSL